MAAKWTLPGQTPAKTPSLSDIPDYFGTGGPSNSAVARLAKIPGADPALFQQFMDAEDLRGVISNSTGDYFKALVDSQPKYNEAVDADLGEIDQIMNPMGYQAALQSLRERNRRAMAGLDKFLLGDMRRGLSQGQIGGGGAGMSSYLARIAAGESARIRAQAERDATAAERTDLSALMAARQASAGKRTGLIDSVLSRLLQPVDVAAKANSIYSDTLSRAIQNALLNSMTGLATKT